VGTAAAFVAANGPWMLLAPLQALALLPGLALALLSSHPEQAALEFHYGVELVPVAALAGLVGARRLLRVVPASVVAAAMCIVAAASLVALGPPNALAASTAPTEAHRAAVEQAVALVPAHQGAVSAQSNLAPRFAHRAQLWEFPGHWERSDWVVVDRYGFRSGQSLDAGFDGVLAAIREGRTHFTLVFEADGVAVYRAARP